MILDDVKDFFWTRLILDPAHIRCWWSLRLILNATDIGHYCTHLWKKTFLTNVAVIWSQKLMIIFLVVVTSAVIVSLTFLLKSWSKVGHCHHEVVITTSIITGHHWRWARHQKYLWDLIEKPDTSPAAKWMSYIRFLPLNLIQVLLW